MSARSPRCKWRAGRGRRGAGGTCALTRHIRGLEYLTQLEQGRLVQSHRVTCPYAKTIGVVPLTITRWLSQTWSPHADQADDLHQEPGRYPRRIHRIGRRASPRRTRPSLPAATRRGPRARRSVEDPRLNWSWGTRLRGSGGDLGDRPELPVRVVAHHMWTPTAGSGSWNQTHREPAATLWLGSLSRHSPGCSGRVNTSSNSASLSARASTSSPACRTVCPFT